MILWDHVTYKTCFISTCTRSMDTKYGKVVTYHEVLPFISSYDHLHKCSWEVMWQIKYVLSPLQKTNKHQTRQGVILPWQATPLKSQDHLITWNNVRSNSWPLSLVKRWLQWEGLERKLLSRHWLHTLLLFFHLIAVCG